MYKIIGTDQKEYGPVSSAQINQWIVQGRVNAQTKAQSEGGEWKPLGDFPEFTATFGLPTPSAPSAASPPPLNNPVSSSPNPVKTSGLAITSLILGILGFFSCGFTAIIGLILGIMAMVRIKKSAGATGGFGIALAGTIVSGVFLLMLPVGLAMMLPALAKAKQRAETIQCINNVRQLALAVRLYSGIHADHYPPAATWCDAIKAGANSDKVYQCPAGNSSERCHYAYNSRLDSMDERNVDPNTVLFFETEGGWNVSGGPELLLPRSRHGNLYVVAFADGHVEQVRADALANLRWTP
jgi:prepilin-type processing-associated H-X9-DG protein